MLASLVDTWITLARVSFNSEHPVNVILSALRKCQEKYKYFYLKCCSYIRKLCPSLKTIITAKKLIFTTTPMLPVAATYFKI